MAFYAAWLVLMVLSQGVVLMAKNPCSEGYRTKVSSGSIRPDGGLVEVIDGTYYPKGTFWKEKRHWWTCPCLSGQCVRICKRNQLSSGFPCYFMYCCFHGSRLLRFMDMQRYVEKLNLTMSEEQVRIKVWEGNHAKWVLPKEQFRLIKEAHCEKPYQLTIDDPQDGNNLLSNGSLFYTYQNMSDGDRIESEERFCIIPQEGKEQVVLICFIDTMMSEGDASNLKFKIYPAFFILSAVFLLLTLVAFFLTPDHNTLHGRSVVCQSGCLLIMYIGLTINYLSGETNHIKVCRVIAYITYYFLMASFFWLNVMCIDIYLAFKSSTMLHHERKLMTFALYAWGTPLIIFLITLALDLTTNSKTLSPGIGANNCWFQGFVSELLYFNGPVLILLLLNVLLFGLTALGLWRMKKESKKMFKSGESRVQGGHSQHDKDRLILYVKLFLLMGGTWIMEIISWAIGGPNSIWFITDTVNCLRGVLIFWFCVWSNTNIRKALRDRFKPKQRTTLKSSSVGTSLYNISSRVSSSQH